MKVPQSHDSDPRAPGSASAKIAVTLGDPRGIGPEVTARALREPGPLDANVLLVGPEGLEVTDDFELVPVGHWHPDDGTAQAGRIAAQSIERAVSLASEGTVDAIVTAPISKAALAAAGYAWPGHTEMLRDLTGVPDTALCLAADETPMGAPLRVVLVTGHMALRRVPEAYTVEQLYRSAHLTDDGLRSLWGIEKPRLSICAFNPHASDDGLFGDEETRVCQPTIARLRAEGLDVNGPFPADTVFVNAMQGGADAVLAPYHDVGMTAIKTAAFGKAVNVTLGLPFPRTSPDHGTAFDIAGTGRANPSSMRAALEAARAFALRALTAPSNSSKLANG